MHDVPARKPRVPPSAETMQIRASESVILSIKTAKVTDRTRARREAMISEEKYFLLVLENIFLLSFVTLRYSCKSQCKDSYLY
ncbi:MAG: hypothetical protein ACYSW3_28700, partial [Planctomycetota bacterium]